MILNLPMPPSANVYWRHTRTGRVYVSDEAIQYRAAMSVACHGLQPLPGPVALRVEAYMPSIRRDLDNTLKVLCDALQGWLYDNDNQIQHIEITRHKATRKTARVEVEICSWPNSL